MTTYSGFWSYVHADDATEGERISALADDVRDQFHLITGDPLELFLDKAAISWGDKWKDRIDEGLLGGLFFVPVMTPRYFQSAECRREFQLFARHARKLGSTELVLPILYVNVPALHDEDPADDLISLARGFQWTDWTDLRFEDRSSSAYRRAVATLSDRLANASRSHRPLPVELPAPPADEHANEPGVLDRLAAAEEALPALLDLIARMNLNVQAIGAEMHDATDLIVRADRERKGFAARLAVAKRLAGRLRTPVDEVTSDAGEFSARMYDVDAGFRTIIELAPEEIAGKPAAKTEFCEFFDVVRDLAAAIAKAAESTQDMLDSTARVENISRELRPTFRHLREGLTMIREVRVVSDEWVVLIDGSGVDCGGSVKAAVAPTD